MVARANYRFLITLALGAEVCAFYARYAQSPQGLAFLKQLTHENNRLDQALERLKKEISDLERDINEFQRYPWRKEEIARNSLQMAYPNEEIFLIA
jgi:cell division protein FtsB